MGIVAGLDGCKTGWVGVVLEEGRFVETRSLDKAVDVFAAWPEVAVLAIDIPIGLPEESTAYRREADFAARGFLRGAASSVFPTLPFEVLSQSTFAEALARSQDRCGRGLSRQSYALASKIIEVNELAENDARVHEVHPEVSFREMAGRALDGKKTWNGLMQRRGCLESVGIRLPDDLPQARGVGADDVLDAAAAAWSATRIASGQARTLPDPPFVGSSGKPVVIYY